MNKTKRIAFGIGIVLAVLAVLTASAAADNVVYFDPDPSCAAPGNTTVVTLRMNITDGVASLGCDVYFNLDVVNITSGAPGDLPTMWLFSHKGNWVRFGGWSETYLDLPPGDYKLADLTLVANNTGTSALHFDPVWSILSNELGHTVPATWNDGTFNCPCGVPKPDLVITDKYETPAGDGTFTVTYTVTNTGDADAGASTTAITTTAGGSATDSVPALAAGASCTNTVAGFNCPCGTTVTVTVCADDGNVVDESNEDNNCMLNDHVCPECPKPDLVITEKYETLLEGGTFTVTYTIANTGDGDAGASTTSITADGQSASDPVPALAADASYTSTVSGFNCPCGTTVTVTVCADSTSVVDESDETNNCLSNDLVCHPCPKPDLVITEKHATLLEGGTFTVTYTIANTGDGDADASTTSITADGQSATDSVPALAAGASHTSTVSGFNCPCGTTITVTVCADSTSVVDESDETNNCLSNELTCQLCGLPDLVITDIWYEIGSKKNTYDIFYNIANIGDANAGRSTSNLTIDGGRMKRDGVKPLAAGETRTESIGYRSKTAPSTTTVCADFNSRVPESDETNNCLEETYT